MSYIGVRYTYVTSTKTYEDKTSSINKVAERTQQVCGDLGRVGRSYFQVGPVTLALPGESAVENKRDKDMR